MSWYPYDEDVYSKLSVFPSVRTRDTRRDEKGSSVTLNLMCSGEATGCFFFTLLSIARHAGGRCTKSTKQDTIITIATRRAEESTKPNAVGRMHAHRFPQVHIVV
jgi:hypothetical protein